MKIYTIVATFYLNVEREDDSHEYVSGYRYVFDSYTDRCVAKEHATITLVKHIKNCTSGIDLPKDLSFEDLQDLAMQPKPTDYQNAIVYWVCELDILERKLI